MDQSLSASDASVAIAPLPFPSLSWFEQLAGELNRNRIRQEQLGYVDCVVQIDVLMPAGAEPRWSVQITFEEFAITDVRRTTAADAERADFVLEASLATWMAMIDSIVAGGGRPGLDQTLNHLSHFGRPLAIHSADPLRRDLYFRYNQSLQEMFNACARFATAPLS